MENVIETGDKLIAEFMEKKYFAGERMLKYHSSWDWLHSAFDKFKTMQLKEWEVEEGVKWNHKYSFYLSRIGNSIVHKTILDAFNALVEGIRWYNTQTSKPIK